MLVLSRRVNDTIVLPDLNVSIEILEVKGRNVRVGVDAPIEVKVLRGELESSEEPSQKVLSSFSLISKNEQEVREQLDSLSIALTFLKKILGCGEINLAVAKLTETIEQLQASNSEATNSDMDCRASLDEDIENERKMLAGFLSVQG